MPPGENQRLDVEIQSTVVYNVLGKEFELWQNGLEASPADKDAIAKW